MVTSSSTRRMIGRVEETSASFEARSAPRSYPIEGETQMAELLDQSRRGPPRSFSNISASVTWACGNPAAAAREHAIRLIQSVDPIPRRICYKLP